MHVLHLPSWYMTPEAPNLGTFFRDQATALKRSGMQVGLVFYEPRSLKSLRLSALTESHGQLVVGEEDGLPTWRRCGWNTAAQTYYGGRVHGFFTYKLARQYIKKVGRPDVIHAQASLFAGTAARAIKRRLGIPYVLTEHITSVQTGDLSAAMQREVQVCYEMADDLIAVSAPLAKAMEKIVPGRTIRIVPNIVETAYWTLPPHVRRSHPFTFVSQAHLIPRKGLDLLIKAFAAAFPEDPAVRLRIGGHGPMAKALREIAAEKRVTDRVELPGSLLRDDVRKSLWNGNCFVLPSYAENFGVVLIEALSTGLPLVSTRCGGPEDIIEPETGILIEPGDLDALIGALKEARCREWADSSVLRQHAHERFGYEQFAETMRTIYRAVCHP